jgi:hypothetical protein
MAVTVTGALLGTGMPVWQCTGRRAAGYLRIPPGHVAAHLSVAGRYLDMKIQIPAAMSGRRRWCALLVFICATAVVLPRRGFTSSLHAWPTSAPCTSSRVGADSVHQLWSRGGAGRWCAGGSWQQPSGCTRRCGLDATLRLRGGDVGPRAELEPEGACIFHKSYIET